MASSILVVRDQQVLLDDVTISSRFSDLGEGGYLQVQLFSDSRELARHGFALNCITFTDISNLDELQGKVAVFHEDDESTDVLAESMICEPGQALKIKAMQLNFGEIVDGSFSIDFLAVCYRVNDDGAVMEDDIRVLGCLNAEISD